MWISISVRTFTRSGATLYHVRHRPPAVRGGFADGRHAQAFEEFSLLPAEDHVNTALSSGVGEIIEVSMAKKREERYGRTEDMLEDLRLVQSWQSPGARPAKSVDLDALRQIEETGKTVDIGSASGSSNPLSLGEPADVPNRRRPWPAISPIINFVLIIMKLMQKMTAIFAVIAEVFTCSNHARRKT